MPRFCWSHLNKQQVGAFAEYFVKMEFTMHGFQVYGTEVDDRGIDFVARYESGPFLEIQVKSVRKRGYVFMQKEKFRPRRELHLALGLLFEREEPKLFLIPSLAWTTSDALFVSRDYPGLKSKPEWGLQVSVKSLVALQAYSFERVVERLKVNV